jgi:hypothetical protein
MLTNILLVYLLAVVRVAHAKLTVSTGHAPPPVPKHVSWYALFTVVVVVVACVVVVVHNVARSSSSSSEATTFFYRSNDVYICALCWGKETDGEGCPEPERHVGKANSGVLSFSRSTSPRNNHLDACHPIVEGVRQKENSKYRATSMPSQQGSSQQPSATAFFGRRNLKLTKFQERLAFAWCDAALPYTLIERPSFTTVFGPHLRLAKAQVSRSTLARWVVILAEFLQSTLKDTLKGKFVSVMLDCGTVLRNQLLNICIAYDAEKALFWGSFRIRTPSAIEIAPILDGVLAELRGCGAFVVAVVTDNASGIVNATLHCTELPESEVIEVDSDTEETEEEEDQEIDDFYAEDTDLTSSELIGDSETFAVPVRCWAHTVQLCMSDIFKQTPEGARALGVMDKVLAFFKPKKVRFDLEKTLRGLNRPPKPIIRPTDVRWNSRVRALVRMLELQDAIDTMMARSAPTPQMWSDVLMSLVVLMPFAWMSDFVQSDKCTILVAQRMLAEIDKDLTTVENASSGNESMKRLVAKSRTILSRRKKSNFDNDLTAIFALLEPSSRDMDEEETKFLTRALMLFNKEAKRECSMESISIEINRFATRSLDLRQLTFAGYWSSSRQHPYLTQFATDLSSALLTEAAVERSFGDQCRTATKFRNRLTLTQTNSELFVRINGPILYPDLLAESAAVDDVVEMKKPRREDLDRSTWDQLVQQVLGAAPPPERFNLRSSTLALKVGDRVLHRCAGPLPLAEVKWWKATVVSELLDGKHCIYYSETKEPGMLDPVKDRTKWKRDEEV